jgi:sugar phosphate isomerase/epimerase
MNPLIVGVNTAMFDGIDTEIAFRTIREAGFGFVELAYNQGYVGNISPQLFSRENADTILDLLQKYQLKSHTLGSTMNLAAPDAVAQFSQRIHFANMIGATWLAVCIGRKADRQAIINNLRELAPRAADLGCVICIENGGDPNYDLFRLAQDGFDLLEAINHPAVGFNIDAGNIVSLRPDTDAIAETQAMLPAARHCHIKDVLRCEGEFFFPAIGAGELNYLPLLKGLEERQIPCSLEIPLRMHRKQDTYPQRSAHPIAPQDSLAILIRSRETLEKMLGYSLKV